MPPESWELQYDPRVRKRLEKIRDISIVERIEKAARQLKDKPYSGKLLRGYPGVRSKRVTTSGGEYRIIYTPLDEDKVVFIILIAPREEVYKLLRQNPPR